MNDENKSVVSGPAESVQSNRNNIITVVRDPDHVLGKRFTPNPDGTISKQSAVSVSVGIAVMRHVETHDDLADLIKSVGDDPHAAIINASFNGIEIGERFIILSERQIEQHLGIPRSNREQQKGVHEITLEGESYNAVGRFKENVRPSSWQFFDRDIDQHTPDKFSEMTFDEWMTAIKSMLPSGDDFSYCRVGSTSSRVLQNGQPVGGGNGHTWIKFSDPSDVERFRTAIMIAAAGADMTWPKPRYSHKNPDTVVGHSLTTIIDPSVLTPGRLVFIGKPVVSGDLTVEPLSSSVHIGANDTLDTTAVVLPDASTVRELTRKAGVEMDVQQGSTGLRITAQDLTLDTEIEAEDQGVLTVREILERGITGKIRCQTPFRDSSSFAAFFSTGADGNPFVFDIGTSITHWLNAADSDGLQLAKASGLIKRILPLVKTDSAAALEVEAVDALAVIRQHSYAEFHRVRAELKQANKNVSLIALDGAIKARAAVNFTAPTHHGYASDVIARLAVGQWRPIGYEGSLYVVDEDSGLWVKHPVGALIRLVAETHDGKDNCERSSDYSGIANHAISLATNDAFFENAPVGLACPDGFYQIVENEVVVTPLSPAHRQRVKIEVTPKQQDTPLFDTFLHETFASTTQDEEQQQVALVQEISGAIMLGLMHKHQKAVQFYDPFGRAGKGTLERILRQLVPPSFVTAVSPFVWDKEYYVASLAGARLNVVGELPDSDSIPAAVFKTVTGGDLLTGRHPTHRPISFKNEAAHLFMSNYLINTKDHSEAFFSRWLIVEFPNSRLRSGLPLDPGLPERIIQNELPGIAYWALQGAIRLMRNGQFSGSSAHDRLMAQWRCSTNSLEEFIRECCDLAEKYTYKRSSFYRAYTSWCKDSGRRGFAKGKVRDLLANNIGMGISLKEINGYETFRGLRLKPSYAKELEDAVPELTSRRNGR